MPRIKSKSKVPAVIGRPTLYNPDYCQQLIEHRAKGFSFSSFAGMVGCCVDTLYEWTNTYADFKTAKELAYAQCLLAWEEKAMQGISGKLTNFNATVFIFSAKNLFKEYREGEKEVTVNNVNITLDPSLDLKDAAKKYSELMKSEK